MGGEEMVKKLRGINKKILLVIALLGGVFLSLATVKTMAYTDSPGFCRNCHTMQSEYTSFMDSTHSGLSCNDCHLPHNNIGQKLFFKGRAGMTHVYYNSLGTDKIPNVIHATNRTKETVNENCISCHKSTLTNVSHNAKDNCVSCHQSVPHGKGFKDEHFNKPPKSGELLDNKGGY
jgi:cytochrome c nitrite reductase small subunit